MTDQPYDSRGDTLEHITKVRDFLTECIARLEMRSRLHDLSKLEDPEKSMFDLFTPQLRKIEYGSPEYKLCLEAMGPALIHHYENNSHHPEHFQNGINGMSLVDLIEMLADWKAAGSRHEGGNLETSLVLNRARFKIDDQLFEILRNTARELKW